MSMVLFKRSLWHVLSTAARYHSAKDPIQRTSSLIRHAGSETRSQRETTVRTAFYFITTLSGRQALQIAVYIEKQIIPDDSRAHK
jgi:REP element-mobilizing transposase RayT